MSFSDDVLSVIQRIPRGQVLSYGDVAERAGYARRMARQVGWVLARCDPDLRWFRVVRDDGSIADRPSGPATEQAALLAGEGIEVSQGPRVDMGRYRWDRR